MAASIRQRGSHPLAALKHRNFRFYWSGQCVSVIGTWMQRASQSWLVLTMTDSPLLLSVVSSVQFVPVLFLGLYAGALADRVSKRKLLLITRSCLGLQALILAALVYTGRVQYWHVVALAAAQGVCSAFDTPSSQSLVYEMVGKQDLMNAIALNSALFNAARIIGPAIGGLTMDHFGPAMAFLLNGIGYFAVVIALLSMDLKESTKETRRRNLFHDIGEGIAHVRQSPLLRDTLLLVGLVGIFGLNMSVLVPVLAKDVFHREATGYGVMMSFMGAGSFLGAVTLAAAAHLGPKRRLLYAGAITLGACQLFQAVPTGFALACATLFLTGIALTAYGTTANSSIQIIAPDHLRGRVMSLHTFVDQGSAPLGFLFAGAITDLWGPSGGFAVCGALTVLSAVGILWIERHRTASPAAGSAE